MITIPVAASRNYNVIMGSGLLAEAGDYISDAIKPASPVGKKICIITDATVDTLYGQEDHAITQSLKGAGFQVYKFVFPGGEDHKNMDTIAEILNYLADNKFSRSDLLLALGGGITGDVTGYAAASYLRGVEFIQVPTTLLATVDSSVGGKTGVNLNAGKNLAGAFWQPSLVLFDENVLDTLSYHIKLDGIAEALKSGVIGDAVILQELEECQSQGAEDKNSLTAIAAKAVTVKRQVVESDEREHGSRQLLNFGHTIAHAIEKCSNYRISHGHAVAMGMDMVSRASDRLGWSEGEIHPLIHRILEGFQFPLDCPYSAAELTEAALQDKKIRGSEITLVIPVSIGHCDLKTIPTSQLEAFIQEGLNS
jgi:3-dehydroquinate synthase